MTPERSERFIVGEAGVLITNLDGSVRRADGQPLTEHDKARIAGREPVQEQIDTLPLAGPLPFPGHLPRERWPFIEIRDLPDPACAGQLAPDMFFYLRDRHEWLVRNKAEAVHIRRFHPRAKVTIDPEAYGEAPRPPRAAAARPSRTGREGREAT